MLNYVLKHLREKHPRLINALPKDIPIVWRKRYALSARSTVEVTGYYTTLNRD